MSAEESEDREVGSAAPSEERKVVGEGADTPAGQGEEAEEAGVEGGQDDAGTSPASPAASDESEPDAEDDRDDLAKEIETDPSSNPEDPLLREIKGG